MVKHSTEENISLKDIEELTAIYDDYLYMVRQHELVFSRETIDELSFRHVMSMYPECKDPRKFVIPWLIDKLNVDEIKEFENYTKNNIPGDGSKIYVSIEHIRTEENNSSGPIFVIPPYKNMTIYMQLPSMMENYTLSYPEGATLGNTEFHIDGRYKTVYLGDKYRDKPIADCMGDENLVTEITDMINLGECYRQNGYVDDNKFGRMAVNVYAAEIIGRSENNLLELLGSFAEKVKNICHARYHEKDSLKDIKRAQEEGFLNLPSNFQDYLNIRNFMRHQWDTLDDLDDFSLQKSEENKRIRAERLNSFIKFCDKTLYQRMVSCIEALHQMQQIISRVNPNRMIRDINESNSKFMARVKITCQQNPDKQIEVEMNYNFGSDKYSALSKNLQKKKIFPNVKLVDVFNEANDKLELMKDYEKRSFFLRNIHGIECYAMGHCQRHGVDKNNRGAWFYLMETGLITPEECQMWQDYTTLRNNLAHNYFDEGLRNQLNEIDDKFLQDFNVMAKRIYDAGPEVKKVRDDVFEYEHIDGEVVTLDYNSHDVSFGVSSDEVGKTQSPKEEKNDKHKSDSQPQREVYDNGIEFHIKDEEIEVIKFPNNICINMDKQSIDFGDRTHWYTDAESFNVLQTKKSTIRTDKNFTVTSLLEEHRRISFRKGDTLLVDCRHRLLLDGNCRIKEFNFKNSAGKFIKTQFKRTANNQSSLILFGDGTSVLFSGKNVTIIHDAKKLSYDTRKEFAETYNSAPGLMSLVAKEGNVH